MQSLTEEIRVFIADELIPFLKHETDDMQQTSARPIRFEALDTPLIEGRISETESQGFVVHISTGWMLRYCLTLSLIEGLWATFDTAKRVVAVDFQHPFDTFYFTQGPPNPELYFSAVPDLADLFLDGKSREALAEALDTFEARFRTQRGGAVELGFDLPFQFSASARRSALAAFQFLLHHEIAHISRWHDVFLQTPHYALDETSDLAITIDQYKKKACEIDADTRALMLASGDAVSRAGSGDMDASLREFLRAIAVLFAGFDLSRRSVRNYQGFGASHPLPDLRFFLACHAAKQSYEATGTRELAWFGAALVKGYEPAVTFAVRTFQHLGVTGGAFYATAGRLVSLDDQLNKDFMIQSVMQEEIHRIEMQYEVLQRASGSRHAMGAWRFGIFGLSEEEEKQLFKDNMLAMFRDPKGERLKTPEQMMAGVRERFNIRSGDYMILVGNSSFDSPFHPEGFKPQEK